MKKEKQLMSLLNTVEKDDRIFYQIVNDNHWIFTGYYGINIQKEDLPLIMLARGVGNYNYNLKEFVNFKPERDYKDTINGWINPIGEKQVSLQKESKSWVYLKLLKRIASNKIMAILEGEKENLYVDYNLFDKIDELTGRTCNFYAQSDSGPIQFVASNTVVAIMSCITEEYL